MNASENGFIDAHNWLFTAAASRWSTTVRGRLHAWEGRARRQPQPLRPGHIAQARNGEIYRRLARIAGIRLGSVALQRGVQVNLELQGDRAAFYRVYQKDGRARPRWSC